MSHYKDNNPLIDFLKNIYISYIPNRKDNLKQIIIKILFIVSLITLIVSASYIANYFFESQKQNNIIDNSRQIWHSVSSVTETVSDEAPLQNEVQNDVRNILLEENSDFKGWITIGGTQVDNPIYQAKDNQYYLNHNQKRQKSVYGALFFDCTNLITENKTDKNLIIFGHEMKNGSMFGSLKKLKSLNFYKEHPTIEFSTLYQKSTYKIYAIFILNASKADDNDYIYNIYRQKFADENDFDQWTAEAYQRSIINTNVDTVYGDDIITLVTCSEDFENARLVIMARRVRDGEDSAVDTSTATTNPNPRYPKKWYDKRNIKYPF